LLRCGFERLHDLDGKVFESASGLGVAVAKVLYRNVGADGKEFALNLFITLVFKQVDGRWFLVFDQNTVV